MEEWLTREEFERSYIYTYCWIAYGKGKVYEAYYDRGVYRVERDSEAEFYKGKIIAVMPFRKPEFPKEVG
jgi:hypothetical protein